ncbi:MAG: helix-turn-helix domain-containing protein [Solirubrobacterales bacterium]|nr:helix-turn-helix domain-containing protein [Solirubrobacterales bacterium]
MPRRRIVIVTFPDPQPLDLVGPAEVFGGASDLVADWVDGRPTNPAYEIEVVAEDAGPIATRSGAYSILPAKTLAQCRGPIDTLIVAGGSGVLAAERSETMVEWVRSAAQRSRRVASVCSGSLLLAAAGLLDGHRATSHWATCSELARRYPEVEVDPDPIFVQDGRIWTSAGVTAGMDLSLALVAEDLGEEVALEIARWLVLFLRRPGGQAQFSSHISAPADRPGLRDLQIWMADHLDQDLRVETLAERAAMSPRNFARSFRRETGVTPGTYVETLRLERARQCLEGTSEPVEEIARRCGFGTPETMRRAFARRLGVSPAGYRERFRREPAPV